MNAIEQRQTIVLVRDTEDITELTMALSNALSNSGYSMYTYMRDVSSNVRSEQIFSPTCINDFVRLSRGLSPEEVAGELMQLIRQGARYNPPENPGGKKGWGVTLVRLRNCPTAHAKTEWVD